MTLLTHLEGLSIPICTILSYHPLVIKYQSYRNILAIVTLINKYYSYTILVINSMIIKYHSHTLVIDSTITKYHLHTILVIIIMVLRFIIYL